MPNKADAGLPWRDDAMAQKKLENLLNLGPKSSAWLVDAGITSLAKVKRLGPIEVCRRLRARGHPVSVVMAYALEGALAGCHWNALPVEVKEFLRQEYAVMKQAEIRKS